ncbi:MAG: hypothetical protein ACYDDT_08860 [Sulfuricella sp.]
MLTPAAYSGITPPPLRNWLPTNPGRLLRTGNISEGTTLDAMLTGLNAPPGAMVIMDAGIATEANLAWLIERGYRYLVVRRGGERQFDASRAMTIETAGGETLRIRKEIVQVGEAGQEVRLYCHSAGREAKETALVTRATLCFEAGLQKIADGLGKSRCEKRHDKLLERIGRPKEKSRGASQHYTVSLTREESGKTVTAMTWEKAPVAGRWASVDLGAGLSVRAGDSHPVEGARHSDLLGGLARDSERAAPGDGDFRATRWPNFACEEEYSARTGSEVLLCGAGYRSREMGS